MSIAIIPYTIINVETLKKIEPENLPELQLEILQYLIAYEIQLDYFEIYDINCKSREYIQLLIDSPNKTHGFDTLHYNLRGKLIYQSNQTVEDIDKREKFLNSPYFYTKTCIEYNTMRLQFRICDYVIKFKKNKVYITKDKVMITTHKDNWDVYHINEIYDFINVIRSVEFSEKGLNKHLEFLIRIGQNTKSARNTSNQM